MKLSERMRRKPMYNPALDTSAVIGYRVSHEEIDEVAQLEAYCDKLVAGMPYLPKDIEVLRKANHAFAQQVHELEAENAALLIGIRNARHCLTSGKLPIEGGNFDIGTTYTKLSILLGEPHDTLLTGDANG